MSFVVRKRELTDPAQLQAIIVEHADDLERGLTILDSRLLLGLATIDVVGLDDNGSLVLIVVGLVADEEMFLRAVEAYSWCLEYPAAIQRLYPAAQLSATRPPRVMFIVERVPDAFHRKIKQLGFHEVDCVEFRHLDVDGTPAVYFESLARLRRNPVPPPPTPEEPLTPPPPVGGGRSTTQKLQRLLGPDRGSRESAPIVRVVQRTPVRPDIKPFARVTRTERGVEEDAPSSRVSASLERASTPRVADGAPESEPALEETAAVVGSPAPAAATAVAAALDDVPHLLGPAEARDVLVEAFVATKRPAENGHVVTLPNTILEVAAAIEEDEPSVVVDSTVIAESQPNEVTHIVVDVVAAEVSTSTGPAPELPIVEQAAAVGSATEHDTVAAAINEPEPEPGLELEQPVVQQPAKPVIAATETASTEAPAEPSADSPRPIAPVVAPAPVTSVFSRRPAEAAAARPEPRVSFAGVAKDLSPPAARLTETQPSVASAPASVEEVQRGVLDDGGGTADTRTTDDRATAFVKASGPFAKAPTLKRPRTIAPPPSDGQPIAGGPKLETGANRIAPSAAARMATEAEPPKAPAQTIGEVQFPNDGVLTRQWMEFLNQMAAGK